MRLSRETLKQGLRHQDPLVRNVMLSYFSEDPHCAADILPVAIEAMEQYGGEEAFEWLHQVTELPVDQHTIGWVLQQCERRDWKSPVRPSHFAQQLASAPAELLRANREAVDACSLEKPEDRQKIERRIELLDTDPEDAWRQLEELSRELAGALDRFPREAINRAKWLIEPIVQAGEPFHERVLDVLRKGVETLVERPPEEQDELEWQVGLGIILVGHLRLETAMPDLIALLNVDWDWYNDEVQYALRRIGTPETCNKICQSYGELDWSARLFLTGALERMYRVDLAGPVQALLAREEDPFLRHMLAASLAFQFNDELLPRIREVFEEYPEDPERRELAEIAVAHLRLADLDAPERDAWEASMDDIRREREAFDELRRQRKQKALIRRLRKSPVDA